MLEREVSQSTLNTSGVNLKEQKTKDTESIPDDSDIVNQTNLEEGNPCLSRTVNCTFNKQTRHTSRTTEPYLYAELSLADVVYLTFSIPSNKLS